MTTIRALAPLALALSLVAAPAAAVTYDCAASSNVKRSKYGKGSYIAPKIRFVVDEAAGRATVHDSLIQEARGGPIPADYSRDGNRLRFEWSLYVAFKKNRNALADYTFKLNLARMTGSIRVSVHGEFQDTLGKARCVVAQ